MQTDVLTANFENLLENKQFETLIKQAQKNIGTNPRCGQSWKALGLAFKAMGNNTEALKALHKTTMLLPEDLQVFKYLADILLLEKQYKQAAEYFEYLVTKEPKNPDLWNSLGLVYLEINQPKEAADCFKKVIIYDKNFPEININLEKAQEQEQVLNDQPTNQLIAGLESIHCNLLANKKEKKKIKVVFLVIFESVWKIDTVFQKMLEDSYFEPEILICPLMTYDNEAMLKEMDSIYNYFKNKGYPVKKSLQPDGSFLKLSQLNPDMVFITNPYKLTISEYYEQAFLNYLTCYVPYYFMATDNAGTDFDIYNNPVLQLSWKVYWPHDHCYETQKLVSKNKGSNGLTTGYPAMEAIYLKKSTNNSWKKTSKNLKKIIFAPHHTIGKYSTALSSFLTFSETMLKLVKKHKNKVQWSFKPHPILKHNLYAHPDWGKEKTDAYYNFWKDQSYTQLDESEYDDLFMNSDAIIHDCSSFIVEYAFTNKPCLYLVNENNLEGLLNKFGEGVMQIYEKTKTANGIENFIKNVVNETIKVNKSDSAYFDDYVNKYYKDKLPSERIIEDIKQSLGAIS